MNLGAFSILFNDLPLEKTLDIFADLGLTRIELGAAAYSVSSHIDIEDLYAHPEKIDAYRRIFDNRGIGISALGAGGNPVHPDPLIADAHQAAFKKCVVVAERLGVEVVNVLSGTPGGAPGDRAPNWIVGPWPEDFAKAYVYQWEEVLIPYWTQAAAFAEKHGVKVAIEPHPNFSVYNVESLLKLRAAAGRNLGCNFDPSHLIWQGADPCTTIRALGDAIFHVHAKDVQVNSRIVEKNGLFDPKPYSEFKNRSWNFRTCGYGSDEKLWRNMISALAEIGFTGTISVEHEDALMNREEGLAKAVELLQRIIIREPVATMWWEMRAEG